MIVLLFLSFCIYAAFTFLVGALASAADFDDLLDNWLASATRSEVQLVFWTIVSMWPLYVLLLPIIVPGVALWAIIKVISILRRHRESKPK